MTAAFGTCHKHQIKYKGRCPKCHPRRSSSRPVSSRRQHAIIMERLVQVYPPARTEHRYVTTLFVANRWMKRHGISGWAELSDRKYAWLLERSSLLADRWNRIFGQFSPEQVR